MEALEIFTARRNGDHLPVLGVKPQNFTFLVVRAHDDPTNLRNRVLLFAKQRLKDDAVFIDRDAPAEIVEEEEQGERKAR